LGKEGKKRRDRARKEELELDKFWDFPVPCPLFFPSSSEIGIGMVFVNPSPIQSGRDQRKEKKRGILELIVAGQETASQQSISNS